MKKIVLFVLLGLGVSTTYAQVSFGILAGARTSSLRWENPDDIGKKKFFLQWHAGVAADIPLVGRFYLQPQLLASVKGGYNEAKDLDSAIYTLTEEASSKQRTMYLELPVNVLYKQPLGKGRLIAGAGPYIAYGLGGKGRSTFKTRISDDIETYDYKIRFENRTRFGTNEFRGQYYKPFDAGFNIIAGYEFNNGLCFNVNYSRGLTNIAPSDGILSDGTGVVWGTTKNSYLALSVGYFLRKHK